MRDEPKATGRYQDVDFVVTSSWRFYVPLLERTYDDYAAMRDGIERASKAEQAVKRKKLELDVVDSAGSPVKITGVHAGHGRIISKPPIDRYASRALYPAVPWIIEALREAEKLRDRAGHIENALKEFSLNLDPGYRFSEGQHPEQIAKVESEVTEKTKAAGKSSLERAMNAAEPPSVAKKRIRF